MNDMTTLSDPSETVGTRKIDATRGTRNGRVSSQWFARPDDERFLDLATLEAAVIDAKENSSWEIVNPSELVFDADREDADSLKIVTPSGLPAQPTHWSFGQACGLAKAPVSYLRELPAILAGINLQYGLGRVRDSEVKTYVSKRDMTLRAITGPDYGRIFDAEVVAAVRKIAGNGTGDTNWKVPGLLNWSSMTYNPYVDVSKETTTLYASDRDVFIFLVDDTHPIEIGKLANGDPDLVFRGFYVWNSEVGARTMGLASFWLRGVCMNRNLWGVEDFSEMTIRHNRRAPERFLQQAVPALERYATSSPSSLLAGIGAARDAVAADNDEKAKEFLTNRGFSAKLAANILETVEREEQHPARSVWDFVNGITAIARTLPHQDARLDMEREASKLMAAATRGRI